jgi:hypothetical protein
VAAYGIFEMTAWDRVDITMCLEGSVTVLLGAGSS